MSSGEFIAFLPGDNLDLASSSTQSVLEIINDDLSHLLRLPPPQFWQVVTTDQSLQTCLDSFLRFRRRCYDEDAQSVQGSSDLLQQLSQRVFRVYWRMVHPSTESDSAAAAPKGSQQPLPSPAQVADLLYNKWLLDVPKMLDLAVLYGPGSSQLTGELLQQILQLQPKYAEDILTLAEPLAGNLQELSDNVKRVCGTLLGAAPGKNTELLQEVAEAMKYFTDATLTLQALVECLPAAAALLLHPANHGSVLLALAVLHSSLLPLLQRVAQQPDAAALPGLAASRVQRLQQAVLSVVFRLLHGAFCTPAGAAALGCPAAIASAAAAASASAGSSSKKPPPGFSSGKQQQQKQAFDPEHQGQELMNLLMLLAHPSDHEPHAAPGADGPGLQGGLLAAVNRSHHLDVGVAAAVEQGLLALDEAQFDYFLALVDGDRQLLQQRQLQQQAAASRAAAGPAGAASSSSSAAAAGATSSSSSKPAPPAAVIAQQVSSIKELLPDYGDGFLAACLAHHAWSTEQTINCLLEGQLPQALQGLDTRLKTWTPPAASSSGSSSSTAGPSRAAAGGSDASSSGAAGLSWTGLAREAAAAGAAAAGPAAANVALPSLAAAAAAAPRAAVDRRTGRVLGALPGQVRSLTKSIAQELQFEYDDEYDDSFDDLIGPGNDGVCDIEGDDSAASGAKGKPGQQQGSGAAGDEYADEPSSARPPSRQQQQQPLQQQRGRPKQDRLWVLDGKIFNYPKPGAVEVAGQAGAEKALQQAKQAAQEIYGLGPGGNVPLAAPAAAAGAGDRGGGRAAGQRGQQQAAAQQAPATQQQQQQQQKGGPGAGKGGGAAAAAGGSRGPPGAGRGGAAAAGRGRDGGTAAAASGDAGGADGGGAGGRGRGRGRASFDHKEQHKAAIANHHRKDRALSKQAKGMF